MVWDNQKIETATGLNGTDVTRLLALDKAIIVEHHGLSADQIRDAQKFMAELVSGKNISSNLQKIASESARETGIHSQVIGITNELSYRTRHLHKIDDRFDNLYNKFKGLTERNEPLDEKDKITLDEFGILHDLAVLNNQMKALDSKGLITGNETLERLYSQTQKAKEMMTHLDNTFDQKFKMPTGATVYDHVEKKSRIYGKELDTFSTMMSTFVTTYGHASKGIRHESDKATENRISHINPSYLEEKFSLRNFLYSDTFVIDVKKLITPKHQKQMEYVYGKDWEKTLNNKLAEIERRIHDDARSRHGHIIAEGGKGRFANVAKASVTGHQNWLVRDHDNADVRDNIFGREKWQTEGRRETQKVLCSEFIGMTVVAAIQELNDTVRQDIADAYHIEEYMVPETMIKSPISEYEQLALLSPERLLDALNESGALQVVDAPEEISQIVRTETSTKTTQHYKESLANISKKDDVKEDLDEDHVVSSGHSPNG